MKSLYPGFNTVPPAKRSWWRAAPFAMVVLFAFFGPELAPYGAGALDLRSAFETSSARHWFGTADNGADILSLLLHGFRIAVFLATSVVVASAMFGTAIGTWVGIRGGVVDAVFGFVADVLQSFPTIILNIAILAIVERPSTIHVALALFAPGWLLYARVARAQALKAKSMDWLAAARALGYSEWRLVFRHVLPNVISSSIVLAATNFGGVVVAEATLSYLGLGPGTDASFGVLLEQGAAVLLIHPHVSMSAGAAIAATVLASHLLGEEIRIRFSTT